MNRNATALIAAGRRRTLANARRRTLATARRRVGYATVATTRRLNRNPPNRTGPERSHP
jgi:hypothetical protein